MLLRWVGEGEYDGPGTDVVQDVLNALESLPAACEFVPRDLALEWARARRTTEEDAPNAVGNEIWIDIRKAFAAHGQLPGNAPWREDRITMRGRRVRGWARGEGWAKIGQPANRLSRAHTRTIGTSTQEGAFALPSPPLSCIIV